MSKTPDPSAWRVATYGPLGRYYVVVRYSPRREWLRSDGTVSETRVIHHSRIAAQSAINKAAGSKA